jgi:hypothetical protein
LEVKLFRRHKTTIKNKNEMKRFLIMIYACLLFNGNVLAGTKVRVEMQPNSFENPTKPGIPWEREMPWSPQVFLEDNLLSFESSSAPIMIYAYRGDKIIYSLTVPEGSTNAAFPSTLKGDFILYMIYGDTVYRGEINL